MPRLRKCVICERIGTEDTLRFPKNKQTCVSCMDKKRCFSCKEVKNIELFSKDKSRADGHSHRCSECCRVKDSNRSKTRYIGLDNKQKRREYERTRRRTPNRRLREFYGDCIKRLKRTKNPDMWSQLGFSKQEFDRKFPTMLEGKHIDHCIPLSWFKPETPVSISCALPNLQLLDGKLNNSKKNYFCHKPSDNQYIEVSLKWVKENYLANVNNLV